MRPEQLAPTSGFVHRPVPLTQLDPASGLWALGVSSMLILVALLTLMVELRPGPREAPRMTLKQDSMGRVTVARVGGAGADGPGSWPGRRRHGGQLAGRRRSRQPPALVAWIAGIGFLLTGVAVLASVLALSGRIRT